METINYKVVVADISTSSVRILTIPFPYLDVDEVDARDIAEENVKFAYKYIKEKFGIEECDADITIFADEEEVKVYVEDYKKETLIVY